jgi:Gly-Xaa carboxypeptidase
MQNKLHIPNEGIEFILDEGMTMVDIISPNAFEDGMTSTTMALVGIAEKGYMDVNITVSMNQGGHASIAPDHTGIGILSKIITVIEDHPSTPDLLNTNPIIKNLQCISSHTNLFSIHERYMIDHWEYFKVFVIRLLERSKGWKAAITTSQAVDVIHGGVKVNALPQFSYALMNMRIAPHETDQIVAERISKLIAPISHKHNLDFYYNVHSHEPSNSTIGKVIVSFNDALAPSPISPTNEFPFERLSQVIKRVFGDVVVTPALMTANTDTKVSL